MVARLADSKQTAPAEPQTREPDSSRPRTRLPQDNRISWRPAVLPLLVVVLFAALALAAAYGAVPISPLTSAAILLNQTHIIHIQPSWPASDEAILLLYRLPRVVGAALVGAALGVAGVLFQGLLRNPLADPLLLGTSSGAALGATIAFMLPAAFTA